MKRRYRYVAIEVASDAHGRLVCSPVDLPGLLAFDSGDFRLLVHDDTSGRGLFRCEHNRVDDLRSVFLKRLDVVKVLGVSGTIRTARRRYLSRPKAVRSTA